MRDSGRSAILAALGAALLFGASTPFAKLLSIDIPPTLLAGLLYLGSGIGLWAVRLVRDRGVTPPHLQPGDWGWLIAATVFGGVLGPILLMYGLTRTSGATASLLLNLEAVFTVSSLRLKWFYRWAKGHPPGGRARNLLRPGA